MRKCAGFVRGGLDNCALYRGLLPWGESTAGVGYTLEDVYRRVDAIERSFASSWLYSSTGFFILKATP
jgi:hypothetical protein